MSHFGVRNDIFVPKDIHDVIIVIFVINEFIKSHKFSENINVFMGFSSNDFEASFDHD